MYNENRITKILLMQDVVLFNCFIMTMYCNIYLLQITVDDLEFQSSMLTETCWKEEFETGSYPTTVTYHIDTDLTAPFVPRPLKCKIGVTGADRQLDYILNSPPPSNKGRINFSSKYNIIYITLVSCIA